MSDAAASDGPRPRSSGLVAAVSSSFVAIGLGATGVNLTGYLTPYIQADLGIGRAKAGAVAGLFFGATGCGAVLAGRAVGRIGTRRAVLCGLFALATMSTAVAISGRYAVLAAFGLICGFGYAMTTVGTNVAVSAVVPPGRRSLGLSGKQAGGPLLSASFALFAGLTVDRIGWRGVMAVHGGCAALALVGVAIGLRAADVRPLPQQAPSTDPVPPVILGVAAGAFLLSAGAQPFFSWMLPFFRDGMGMSSEAAGVITASATAMSLVGMLCIALLADRLGAYRRVRLLGIISVACALSAGTLATADATGLIVMVPTAMIGIAAYAGASGLMHAVTVDLAPRALQRASGRVITGFFLGAWLSPITFGWAADRGGFHSAWLLSAGLLCAAGTTFVICHRYVRPTISLTGPQTGLPH